MAHPPVTVRLDPRRLDQLKAIGAALNLSNAGVIAEMIREKIAAGIIPAAIPGATVLPTADGVSVELTAGKSVTYSKVAARRFIDGVRAVVNGDEASTVNLDHGFAVLKQGTGFKIAAPFPGPEVAFPGDLALDLADLIEQAIK